MELSDYLKTLEPKDRESFAAKAGTTVDYLYQIAGGHRSAGPKLANRLEKASKGAVERIRLRPDVFGSAS